MLGWLHLLYLQLLSPRIRLQQPLLCLLVHIHVARPRGLDRVARLLLRTRYIRQRRTG
eukprot:COSAG01_NODE_4413_length_5051_cov_1.983845_1_plen_58_part_00